MEREEVQPVDAQEDHEPLANLKSQISNLKFEWFMERGEVQGVARA